MYRTRWTGTPGFPGGGTLDPGRRSGYSWIPVGTVGTPGLSSAQWVILDPRRGSRSTLIEKTMQQMRNAERTNAEKGSKMIRSPHLPSRLNRRSPPDSGAVMAPTPGFVPARDSVFFRRITQATSVGVGSWEPITVVAEIRDY